MASRNKGADVRDIDLGYKDLKRALEDASGGIHTDVGLLSHDTDRPVSTHTATNKGLVNEFGKAEKNIPPRPAHRNTFDENVDEYYSWIVDEVNEGPDMNLPAVIAEMGAEHERRLKAAIRLWDSPPNALATVLKKGFDDPLIETGDMVEEISHRVHDD